MTAKQWRMLEILNHWGGHGTIEVECQWGDYDFTDELGDGEAADRKGANVCRLVVAGLIRSLVKKGYATDDENGYDITDKGRAALERRRERKTRATG
jgi:hypothetical protein